MKEIISSYGIQADKLTNPDTGEVDQLHIYLNNETKKTIEFVQDFQRIYGVWSGFDLAKRLEDLEGAVSKMREDQQYENLARIHNPAVAEAYEHYKTMLALAKEHQIG